MSAAAKPQPGTAVAKTKEKGADALLLAARPRIEPFLPPGVKFSRVMANVAIAAAENPEILECTPQSIVLCVAKAQRLGLEVGDTAYLIPRNKKTKVKGEDGRERDQWVKVLTMIPKYVGLLQIAQECGAIRDGRARCVYANEHFRYEEGLEPTLEHVPAHDSATRGKMIGAYVVLRLPHSLYRVRWMTIDEINDVRQTYSQSWKQGECPPWYAEKTVTRSEINKLPKNPRLQARLAELEEEESDEVSGALAALDRQVAQREAHTVGQTPLGSLPQGDPYEVTASRQPGEEGEEFTAEAEP